MPNRPPRRPAERRRPAPARHAARGRPAVRAPLRRAILRLGAGVLLLVGGTLLVTPLRSAAREAWRAMEAAVVQSRLAQARERAVAEWALRFGISVELAAAIERVAREEGIDPELAFRLVRVESEFRERAESPVGALGLTQLMPATAADLMPGVTREEVLDRDTNLQLGFRYLRWLLRVYDGDVEEALHAYNRGPGTVNRIRAAGGDPANGYADHVLRGGRSLVPYRGNGLEITLPVPLSRF